MKKTILFTFLCLNSIWLLAQRFYPTVVSVPSTGFEQLQNDNPYILSYSLIQGEWEPSARYIQNIAPNIHFTATNIYGSWENNTWTDNQLSQDSFVLDAQNRLSMVYNHSTYNFPGYTSENRSKYIFNYSNSDQPARIDYFEAPAQTPNNYKKTSVTYITYDPSGKRIADSAVYFYSTVTYAVSHYSYDGDNCVFMFQENGTDTTAKTFYTYNGGLLTSYTGMAYDADADEWSLNYADSFEYNLSNQVSRHSTTGYVFRDGVLSFEPFRNETYTYTSTGKLEEMIERLWQADSDTWDNYMKTVITYNTNHQPEIGHLYMAEGTGWSSEANTKYVFHFATGIQPSITSAPSLSVYPNPTTDYLTIETDQHNCSFILHDISGRVCLKQNMEATQKINVSTLENGLYYLTITMGDKHYSQKVLVKH